MSAFVAKDKSCGAQNVGEHGAIFFFARNNDAHRRTFIRSGRASFQVNYVIIVPALWLLVPNHAVIKIDGAIVRELDLTAYEISTLLAYSRIVRNFYRHVNRFAC